MNAKRIASFLPSATEILYALGAGNMIVSATHECDYPEEAKSKPRVIKSSFDCTIMSSKEIDDNVVKLVQTGGDMYIVDEQILKKADPDLIIAQGLCDVCSPTRKEISKAVSVLDKKPEVVILDPHNLDDIFSDITKIAEHIGKTNEAKQLIGSLQKRIEQIKNISFKSRPKVLCIEWLDPPFTAGHWVPQMVEIAGGINGISEKDKPSRRMKLDEAVLFDPDIIILMPCGFDLDRIGKEYSKLASNPEWKLLRAVQKDTVYAVDANSYFSKPGPRTVTGIEILTKIIHPESYGDIIIPDDSMMKINS